MTLPPLGKKDKSGALCFSDNRTLLPHIGYDVRDMIKMDQYVLWEESGSSIFIAKAQTDELTIDVSM